MILSIDPGLTSGWATWDKSSDDFAAGELAFEPLMRYVERLAIDYQDKLVVVCETFTITQQTARLSQAPWSLMITGAVAWVCLREGVDGPHMQKPSDAKAFCPDVKLRGLGYHSRGGGGHHNDAARHLVLYRVNQGWRDPRAL